MQSQKQSEGEIASSSFFGLSTSATSRDMHFSNALLPKSSSICSRNTSLCFLEVKVHAALKDHKANTWPTGNSSKSLEAFRLAKKESSFRPSGDLNVSYCCHHVQSSVLVSASSGSQTAQVPVNRLRLICRCRLRDQSR